MTNVDLQLIQAALIKLDGLENTLKLLLRRYQESQPEGGDTPDVSINNIRFYGPCVTCGTSVLKKPKRDKVCCDVHTEECYNRRKKPNGPSKECKHYFEDRTCGVGCLDGWRECRDCGVVE